MADTDPFGRVKGEDPLTEMGWSTVDSSGPQGVPTEVAAPEQPDAAVRRQAGEMPEEVRPRGVPGVRRRRSNLGCAFAVVVLGFIGVTFAVVVPSVIDEIDQPDAVEPGPFPQPADEPEPSEPGGRDERRDRPARPQRPPQGLERASLLRRGNLAPALRRLRRVTRAERVNLVRIDAQSIIVTVSLSGGRSRVARATWDGEGDVLSTSPGGASPSTFTWSQIDPSAPNRIVRAATRGRSSRAFDYLVLIDAAGLRWSAFLKGGGTFSASPTGTQVSRVG